MTTEAALAVSLESLPIKDLAKHGLDELMVIGRDIENKNQPIARALLNIELIDQIRNKPAVQAFLKSASRSVRVVGRGIFNSGERLSVSSVGYEVGWTQNTGRESATQHEIIFHDIDEAVIIDLFNCKLFPKSNGCDKKIVNDLAKLQPKEIIEYFRQALSTPVAVA